MKIDGQAMFAVKSWDEETWAGTPATEVTGAKLTRATVTYTYRGDIEGESELQYLMTYGDDGVTGSFVGLEQVRGSVGGREGTLVFEHTGTFDAQGVKATLRVAPGSGTGELAMLRGLGSVELVGHRAEYPIQFTYELD